MIQAIRARKSEDGFTLIELLIVIVILGILAGVVVFSVGAIADRGTKSACKSDLKAVEVAVEAYRAKNGTYPGAGFGPITTDPNKFLRSAPSTTNGYTITSDGGGVVTANPANCDGL